MKNLTKLCKKYAPPVLIVPWITVERLEKLVAELDNEKVKEKTEDED